MVSANLRATTRPRMSAVPPAGNGTTTRTGLLGHVCAAANDAAKHRAMKVVNLRRVVTQDCAQ
jgi:hypothetical protein